MALTVKGHKLLIKHMTMKETVEIPKALADTGFKIELTSDQEKREEVASQVGIVLQIGRTCWHAYDRFKKDGSLNPDWEPWCQKGDKILYARYSGKVVEDPDTKERFMVISDEDVQAVVETKDIFEG